MSIVKLITYKEIKNFLKKNNLDLSANSIKEENLFSLGWKYVGNNPSNSSTIKILHKGEHGLIERLTNAIDAVIEKQKQINEFDNYSSIREILELSFPKYFNDLQNSISNRKFLNNVQDAKNQIILRILDSENDDEPTFEIYDAGIGINGDDFEKTILSLQGLNKTSSSKKYLIGTYGQGGSTSLQFAKATIIFSKSNGKIFWTIIVDIQTEEWKTSSYCYKTVEEISFDEFKENQHLYDFFKNNTSGTVIRMINYELTDKNLISDCATKDGKLIDYINTKLFNNNFPIKIVDHRSKYSNDNLFKMKKSNIIFHQNEKYALGSNYKLSISSLVNSKYSGFFSFKLGDKTIQCNYYTILPKNKTDWINDEICNNNYKKFNMNNNSSILYLVSGQNVGFETFNKIKEIGLTYLENRLLVLADLDGLKNLKYSILSSARNGVIKNMLYKSLIKNILINIENIKELYDLNDYIFKKRIEQPLSQKQLLKINKALSKALKKYKAINKVKMFTDVVPRIEVVDSSVEEKKYADYFTKFEIMTTKHIFDTKDVCNIVLLTNAKLTINQTVAINVYLIKNELKDNKEDTDQDFNNEFVENSQITTTDYETKYQNGRIIYKFKLPIGEYGIYFSHKQNADKIVKSNSLIFTVVDDLPKKKERNIKIPNIKVNYVTTGKRIADINEIDNQTYIDIYASHPDLREFIQEYKDNIDEFKEKFAVNLALWLILNKDDYNSISTDEAKNRIVRNTIAAKVWEDS